MTRQLLVSRVRDSLTKSRDLREDLVSRFRPDEGRRRFVGDREVLANGGFEGADAAVRAPLDLLLAEKREPAFDEIEPGGTRRGEVDVKPGMAGKPPSDTRGSKTGAVKALPVHLRCGRPGRGGGDLPGLLLANGYWSRLGCEVPVLPFLKAEYERNTPWV